MKARKIVDEMDSYVPGKSQGEIAEQFGLNKDEIIKLGSNENPWGPSPKAMEAIKAEIKSINRYPESQLHELVEEIAKYADVDENQVIIGGDGADEIIDVLAKTFIDEVMSSSCLCRPTCIMNTCSSNTVPVRSMQDGIWIKMSLTQIQYSMQSQTRQK